MDLKILIVDDLSHWVNMHKGALNYHLGNKLKIDSANSAKQGYQYLITQKAEPYDIILVDMEMEDDFYPLCAGEWLIKQIQSIKEYDKTKLFIVSSVENIAEIANKYNINFIPKDKCKDIEAYNIFKCLQN